MKYLEVWSKEGTEGEGIFIADGREEVPEPRILYKVLLDLDKWHCPYIYQYTWDNKHICRAADKIFPMIRPSRPCKITPYFGTKAIQRGEIGPSEVQRLSTSLSPFDCSVAHSAPLQKSHHFSTSLMLEKRCLKCSRPAGHTRVGREAAAAHGEAGPEVHLVSCQVTSNLIRRRRSLNDSYQPFEKEVE